MPKKKLTEEQKQEQFEKWKESDEFMNGIQEFMMEREKMNAIEPLEMGTKDIYMEWQPYLNSLWGLGKIMKVPGRKAKCNPSLSYQRN